MTRVELFCLGSFAAAVDGERVVSFRSQKERALLAYLAVECDKHHRRDRLAALLWPEASASDGRRNLRLTLHRARAALAKYGAPENAFEANRKHIWAKPSLITTDVERFERLLNPCRKQGCSPAGVCPDCEAELRQGIDLYRGSFLQDLELRGTHGFTEWTTLIRERLQRRAIDVLRRLTEYERRFGNLEAARDLAERQLKLAPWREAAHRQLMGLLARSGERAAALAQFETCKAALRRHLDVKPGAATVALAERIRAAGSRGAPPLPRPATRLVGRHQDLTALERQLARPEVRLLTLTGPGGVGKTRLALALARRMRRAYLDGVYFVRFAAVHSAPGFWSAALDGLNLDESGSIDPSEQVGDFLRPRECLLVLDSYEGMLPLIEPLAEILDDAPQVDLLVTSQSPLRLKQEHTYPLDGLVWEPTDIRDGDHIPEAAQLFVEVVRRQQPGWTLDERNKGDTLDICRQLQGLPLGIELAAAAYSERTLADIRTAVSDQPAALGPLRGAPVRQRSLRAAYEHAIGRLEPEQRAALARLAVFESPFHVEAALEAAAADRRTLAALERAALIRIDDGDWISIHNSIRAFACADLEQNEARAASAHGAHASYYLNLFSNSLDRLRGAQQEPTLEALDPAWPNLRAAWQRSVAEGRFEELAGTAPALAQFCTLRARGQPGEGLLSGALKALDFYAREAGAPPATLAPLRLAHAQLLNELGRFSEAEDQVLRALPDLAESERALALCVRARAATRQGRNEEAVRWAEHAASWFESEGDAWGRALALHRLALAQWEYAPLDDVLVAKQAAHAAAKETQDSHLLYLTQNNLASTLRQLGEYEKARELLEPLLKDQSELSPAHQLGWPHINLGILELVEGNHAAAESQLRTALDLALAKGAQHQAARARYCLSNTLLAQGELESAWRQVTAAMDAMARLDDKAGLASARIQEGEILERQGELEAAGRAFHAAAQLSDEIDFTYGRAVAPVRRGLLALRTGDCRAAAGCLTRGLELNRAYGPESVRQLALAGAARLLVEHGDHPLAESWLAALHASPELAPHVRQEIETWDLPRSDGAPPASDRQVVSLEELQFEIEAGLASFVEGV